MVYDCFICYNCYKCYTALRIVYFQCVWNKKHVTFNFFICYKNNIICYIGI